MSGAPQGSVLGLILFLIYLHDILDILQKDVLLFADDVKLLSPRAKLDVLQRYLQHVWGWALTGNLSLNENKSGHISVASAFTRPLKLSDNGILIKLLDFTRDLGITIDS